MGIPAHQVTTRHLGSAYPFAAEAGLGVRGALIGRDLFGGRFTYDPFELYRASVLTNPNMMVIGQIGRGKSAFVKTYLWRQSRFGHRSWVVDPKGEYGALALALGTKPLALRPGGELRLNPLEAQVTSDTSHEEIVRRRAELTSAVISASLGRNLSPSERTAVELAVCEVSATTSTSIPSNAPTLPQVVDAMLEPSAASARAVLSDRATLASEGRQAALELRRLVAGDLRGMFDGPTTPGLDLRGDLVVLDLSALYLSPALGVLMTCASAWLQAALAQERHCGGGTILVIDEAWAILRNLSVARWLQSSWKLSRAFGISNVAVLHRLSDLHAGGEAGSEQVELAQGLLSDSETRVIYGQPPGEITEAARLLGLSDTEADLVPRLHRGVALWKVGSRSFLVEHCLSPTERTIVDTDARM